MIDKRLILGTEPNPVQDEIAGHYLKFYVCWRRHGT